MTYEQHMGHIRVHTVDIRVHTSEVQLTLGFPIVGGHGGRASPILRFFSKRPAPPSKPMPLMGQGAPPPPPLKNEAHSPSEKTNLPLESEAFFQEVIPRKKSRKIGNCH